MFYGGDITRRDGGGVLVEGISNVEEKLVLGGLGFRFHHTKCPKNMSYMICAK